MADDAPTRKGNYEAVRLNAVQHGILARDLLLPGENEKEFSTLKEQLQNDLRPLGTIECCLVEELAATLWRKKRVFRAEMLGFVHRALTTSQRLADTIKASGKRDPLEVIRENDERAGFEHVCRYEAHLDRKFQRTLGLLLQLQEMRGATPMTP